MTRRAWCPVVVAVLLLAACSSSDGSSEEVDGDNDGGGPVTVPAVGEATEPGSGLIAVGGSTHRFAVTECLLEPNPADPDGARALLAMNGAGLTESGVAFTVELQRFATGTKVITYTDSVTFSDSGRILQAQRIEVAGEVTDLRDPEASTSLIRSRPGGVSAAGLASAPGDREKDGGLIGIALDASC